LLEKKDQFDSILIETSGVTDPTPVSATFFKDPELARQLSLDGIVTLVDALHFERHLDDPLLAGQDNQAFDQIAVADRVLVNKTDLVDPSTLDRIQKRIRGINATAEILLTTHARVDLDRILGIQGFAPAGPYLHDPHFLGEPTFPGDEHADHDHEAVAGHEHDPSLGSFSLLFNQAFDCRRLETWLEALVAADGDNLFRLKGIVAIGGDPRRYVLQGVHHLLELRPAGPWGGHAPESKFVFIGRHLQRPALRAGLEQCLAQPNPPRPEAAPTPRRTA
jgi:G3E family GTPase